MSCLAVSRKARNGSIDAAMSSQRSSPDFHLIEGIKFQKIRLPAYQRGTNEIYRTVCHIIGLYYRPERIICPNL